MPLALVSPPVSPAPLAHQRDEKILESPNDRNIQVSGDGESAGHVSDNTVLHDARAMDHLVSSSSSPALSSEPAALSGDTKRDVTSSLHFLALTNATTCQNYSFSWVYEGPVPNSNLTFSIIQSPLRKYEGYSSYPPSQLTTVRVLSSTVSTDTSNFTWGAVDLMEGWYMLQAEIPDPNAHFLPHMSPVYVANGTDTTCVKYFEPKMYHQSSLTKGDITGIIVGAIAAAGLLTLAFIFPRLWRRDLPSLKKRRLYYLY